MHLEEINNCIAEYEQYNFKFSDDFLLKIRKECNSWKNDWIVSFKKQLRRIRNDEGVPAHDKMDGIRVTTPLVKNWYMALYYKIQSNGSYYIYRFVLSPKDAT